MKFSKYNPEGYYDPDDRTDVGEALLLGRHFEHGLRYPPATDYLRYDGSCWQERKPGAQAVVHALTDLQLEEAESAVADALEKMTACGAQELLTANTRKKAESMMSDAQMDAYRNFPEAKSYRNFALKRRESKSITATLKETRPILEIEPGMLDKDWFLLCTPDGTYDLRKGMNRRQDHNPDDFITRMTAFPPGDQGSQIWQDALSTFFCGDKELIT